MSTNGNLDAYLNVCKNCTFHRLFHFTFHKFHICRLVGEGTCPMPGDAHGGSSVRENSVGIGKPWNWPKRTGGSSVEMFEIFHRDWILKAIFTQKWASVDMNWGGGMVNPRQFQLCVKVKAVLSWEIRRWRHWLVTMTTGWLTVTPLPASASHCVLLSAPWLSSTARGRCVA